MKTIKQQSGIVLILSLVILIILSLIGISGVKSSTLEEKMAGNMRDSNLAFQAAESALLAGERYLNTAVAPNFTCANGLYPQDGVGCSTPSVLSSSAPLPPLWQNIDWTTKSIRYDVDTNLTSVDLEGLSADPRYIIESLGTVCTVNTLPCPTANQKKLYRITARAVGGSTDAVVMLQSTFQI